MSLQEQLEIIDTLVERALLCWNETKGASFQLINVSENFTYLVEGPQKKFVLRVHRENYHSRAEIESELNWLSALGKTSTLRVPKPIFGQDGQVVQIIEADHSTGGRMMVLFDFIDGYAPDEQGDLRSGFEALGEIAALCHEHAVSWQRPNGFARHHWNIESVFGRNPTWGNWRDAPNVTSEIENTLEQVEMLVCDRLSRFGQSNDRYNLIHADMRLANLIVDQDQINVIDFDDCGFGWFMYDFAAAISFFEDDPRVPELQDAWVLGYRKVRHLSHEDEAEIPTLIMLRRLALLAWIGSHIEAPEPQALAKNFAKNTALLGQAYLEKMG